MKQATAKELSDLIVDELRKKEGCETVTSVQVAGQAGVPNWKKGSVSWSSPPPDAASCGKAVDEAIERLQQEYELIADAV